MPTFDKITAIMNKTQFVVLKNRVFCCFATLCHTALFCQVVTKFYKLWSVLVTL